MTARNSLSPHKAVPGGKSKTKQNQKQKSEKAPPKNRVLQHPEDKIRLFQLINEEPPVALSAIDGAVETIRSKQKEYESHIKTGELELSSDDEEEEEEQPQEEEDTAAATEEVKKKDEVEKEVAADKIGLVTQNEETVEA
ncbi:nuclear segregation protein [Trypanosoma cruzi cruzi]|nr:nuclear segregation protein [Trypanosoma cruzi cruzi]